MNKKQLNTKNIPKIVNNYPTKHKEGFTDKEINSLIKEYDLDPKKFYEKLGVNTSMAIEDEIITYHCDIELALRCVFEDRNKRPGEWD